MATLPKATTSINDEAVAFGAGDDIIAVCAPVPGVSAVEVALFGSTKGILDEHGYCQGAAYAALHQDETGLPVLFVAMPVATGGGITHVDRSGVTGTCIISAAAAANGVLEQVDMKLTVTTGGTVGTDQIVFDLSLDGGFNTKSVRLGTALTYTPDYTGIVLSFETGKTLVAGDIFKLKSYGPTWDSSGATAVRTALAAQSVQVRSCIFVGDADTTTKADAVRAAMQTYESANDRFTLARVQLRDQYRDAALVGFRGRTKSVSLTFAEVGVSGDTITRATGSWITDGFTAGDTIVITGSTSNNITAVIASLTATAITLGSEDLTPETTSAATVTAYATLTFAEVGATGDTITRSSGSWVADGFKVGMTGTISGTVLNNGSDFDITAVTATVLTLGTRDVVAEAIGGSAIVATATESRTVWKTSIIANVASITGNEARRIDTSGGYASKLCPISGWKLRRPTAWAKSLREYKHDVHIPDWRVADGALGGWTLESPAGLVVEYDERVDTGLLAANISCLTTRNNRGKEVYSAMSLTRANPGSLLSRTHNMYVANVACSTVQLATENEIGQVLQLIRSSGKATEDELVRLEGRINDQLDIALGDVRGEGPRASSAVWAASRDDVLNVPGAAITGILTLEVNGTIERINTTVRVPAGG